MDMLDITKKVRACVVLVLRFRRWEQSHVEHVKSQYFRHVRHDGHVSVCECCVGFALSTVGTISRGACESGVK